MDEKYLTQRRRKICICCQEHLIYLTDLYHSDFQNACFNSTEGVIAGHGNAVPLRNTSHENNPTFLTVVFYSARDDSLRVPPHRRSLLGKILTRGWLPAQQEGRLQPGSATQKNIYS
jgi:hypothetical protein